MLKLNKIYQGDTLQVLKSWPDEFVDTVITSPPYWGLRDYGVEGQIGLEPTLDEYLNKLLAITEQLKRVLKPTGVMFWNHGDCYGGSGCGKGDFRNNNKRSLSVPNLYKDKPNPQLGLRAKCMVMQNYRLILRMIDQGWILRNTIIWHKPNAMPSSVKDRFSNSYELVFMLVKKKKYWFDLDSVRKPHKQEWGPRNRDKMKLRKIATYGKTALQNKEQNPAGKNPGDVWKIPTQPFLEAHFATFPEKLVLPMIKCSCPEWICSECGKARERISKAKQERTQKTDNPGKQDKNPETGWNYKEYPRTSAIHKTIGWTDCGCKKDWRSGIVLDPFMGSGTVAVVANKLKRDWIGIELSEEYIKIAKKRLRANPKPMI